MRRSYKTALRVKGFRPIPKATVLRSSLTIEGEQLDATTMALKERMS